MNSQQSDSLGDAVSRIWAQVTANSSAMGDMFERIGESFYSKLIRPGDTTVDGGAHTGRHTIPLAQLIGDDGLVLAFEPLGSAAAKLRHLLIAFGLSQRVQLRPEALAGERGKRDFFVVNNMPEFSGLRSRKYVGFVADETIMQADVETIDSVLNAIHGHRPISFMKLDLEGGEFRALQGAEQTLRAHQPCCLFENGLASSAAGYAADEFFGYFERIDYQLYDILGCRVTEAFWTQSGPWYFVAMPRARRGELLPLLWTSALEELLTSPWSPRVQIGSPPAAYQSQTGSSVSTMTGHVDRLETSLGISGWAGDIQSGRAARAVVVTVDGTCIATVHPSKARYDVVAATGHVGLAHSGFELAMRMTVGHHVEVHAEAADGSYVKLDSSQG